LAARPFKRGVTGLVGRLRRLLWPLVPAIAFDRPIHNPFATQVDQATPSQDKANGSLTDKFNNFSVNICEKKDEGKDEPQDEAAEPEPVITSDPVCWFTFAAIGCSLIGIVFSAIGQVREQCTSLTVFALGCCVAALTWQYFAIGIMFGTPVVIFIIIITTA